MWNYTWKKVLQIIFILYFNYTMAKNLFHTLNCVFERLGLTKKFSKDSCREKIQFFFCQEVVH